MKLITIAVLSDLHVGSGARAKDLCPSNTETRVAEAGYKDKFISFLQNNSIHADYLALPGDVSHQAQPAEVKLASEVICDVAAALQVKTKGLIFVPGNHDVDWSVLKSDDPTGVRKNQRYDPIRHQEWIFYEIMRQSKPHVLDSPHFGIWEFDDLLAVGYNSSWKDGPAESVHYGGIANEHLEALDRQLAKLPVSPRLKLFLVHHHPIQYSDPVPDAPDFSVMANAGNLLALLQKYRFDLLIHGHKHKPNFETHIINAGSPLAVLCSGSFSVQLDTRWSGHVNNQFHLVYVQGRDEFGNIFGRVESWTYLSGFGWIKSKSHNGIRHVEPFGTYLQPEELKRRLRPVVQAGLSTRDYLVWSDILLQLPDLKFVPPERAIEVLDSLASEIGFARHGEFPDEAILLRKQGGPSA